MHPSQRVTLKEVARRAGVSYQTVSKLLNKQVRLAPETEARIWEAVQALDYRPLYMARGLRSRRSRNLGYSWTPAHPGTSNPILDTLLQSMLDAAETQDYNLLCFPHHGEPGRRLDAYRELYETGRVDGFFLSSVEYDDPRVLFLLERGVPFVAFGRSNPELEFPCIDVNGGEGLRQAVEPLVSLGHRRIAALAWPEESRVGSNRLQGYLTGMRQAGIQPDPAWILRGEGQLAFGFTATGALLDLPPDRRPTALVALNDLMALGAVREAQRRGLAVGSDLAVTGFDDTDLARYTQPALTSIRQPIWEIGHRLIQMMLPILRHETPSPAACVLL
ncbi:MAG TPA: LacI family DNA-binding transcriptional regulator, partial [Anaerolinea sp.]|nr:LacI family DNA-binding transcriptional regulator [Anaerolinea sp.]